MPVAIKTHLDTAANQTVSNFLWGLLPDSDDILARWARHFQVRRTSPFFLLGTPVGEDCAGAVSFCPPGAVDGMLASPGAVTWLTEADVASRLRELRRDAGAWLGSDFTGQFSLAGAQAKTALLLQEGRWGLPSGPRATTHILKPGTAGFADHDINEHLCLDAARRAGLTAARSRIARFDDQTAIVVERYDRRIAGDTVTRIHQEDACQALGLHPSLKYQNEGGPSPALIAGLFRRSMSPAFGEAAVWRFADALIWNWLIAGTDAHAKNYSILLAGREARLAPLYDVATILPYREYHEKKMRMAMRIGGSYDMYPSHNDWPKAATEMGLPADVLVERVRHLAAVVPQAFADAASDAAVAALERPIVPSLLDLIADRAKRCSVVVG